MTTKPSSQPKQDATFTLVKSMSRSEKRTFSIMTSAYGNDDADYVRIFNYMNKQEEYHEEAAKHHFRKESFVVFYAARKKYLYYKLMESLRRHYDEKIGNTGFYTHLRNAQILKHKGLKELETKEVKRMQNIANKYELKEEKLIAKKHIHPLISQNYSTKGWEQQKNLYKAYLHDITQLKQVSKYQHYLKCIQYDNFTQSKVHFNQLEQLRNNVSQLMQSPDLHFQSKKYLAKIKITEVEIQNGTADELITAFTDYAELWQQHPNMIVSDPESFINTFRNLLKFALMHNVPKIHKKYAYVFGELIKQSKLKKNVSPKIRYELWDTQHELQQGLYVLNGDNIALWNMRKEFKHEIQNHKTHLTNTGVIKKLYNYLIMGFFMQKYEEAIDLAQELLQDWEMEKFNTKCYPVVVCMMLICRYECNYKYLFNDIRRYKRKMLQYNTFDANAQLTISLLSKLMGKKSLGHEQLIFQHYNNKREAQISYGTKRDIYGCIWFWLMNKANNHIQNPYTTVSTAN